MKERLKHTQLSFISGIFAILGLFAAIVFIIMVISYFSTVFSIPYLEYVEYVLFILFVVLIIRKWVTEYEYLASEKSLSIDVVTGQRQKRVLSIDVSNIRYIGSRLPLGYKGKITKLTYKSRKSGGTYLIHQNSGNQSCIYFSPSKKMIDYLESVTEAKN